MNSITTGQKSESVIASHQVAARQVFDRGRKARQLGDMAQAIACFREAVSLQPDYVPTYNNLGNALRSEGEFESAAAIFQQALLLAPKMPVLHCNLGSLWLAQKEYSQAIEAYQQALVLQPDFYLAYANLAKAYAAQRHFAQAEQAYKQALNLKPDNAELYLELGQLYHQYGFIPKAVSCYRAALRLAPSAQAYNSLGAALQDWGNLPLARASFNRALSLKPDFELPRFNLAQLYENLGDLAQARTEYERALAADPDSAKLRLYLEMVKRRQADWHRYAERLAELQGALEHSLEQPATEAMPMLNALLLPLPPTAFRVLAEQMAPHFITLATALETSFTFPDNPEPARLKIGYLSPDFRCHAVGTLIADLFQYHRRPDFEVFAYSLLPQQDEWTERVKRGCDHFMDVSTMPPLALARRIHADGIHILIDLAGYTSFSRTLALALKPAPVQIQYMGYPGTLGADFITAIIADRHLIPETDTEYYSEQICYLPHAWATAPMQIAAASSSRADLGLPEEEMVYCCLNSVHKIEPEVFACWMEILDKVPGSVLWLLDGGKSGSNERLRATASEAGIAPERLLFAEKRQHDEYLALYRLADLFLDTFVYNAGATAVGALAAGLPLLTSPGEHYAARMGASLCHAVGLPELIADTRADYVRMAVELGESPERRALLKNRLADNLTTAPLFQPGQLVLSLEESYKELWRNVSATQPLSSESLQS